MHAPYGSFQLCWEGDLGQALEGHLKKVLSKVEAETEAKITGVDEEAYIEHLVAEFLVEPVTVYPDKLHATHAEEMIPAERYDRFMWNVQDGESYPRPVYTFRLPFTGDRNLLKLRPSQFYMRTVRLFIDGDCLCFKGIDFNNAEQLTRDAKNDAKFIADSVEHIRRDVDLFNSSLPDRIRESVRARRERIRKRVEAASSFGIPVVQSGAAPSTYSVPAPVKRKSPLPPDPPVQGGPLRPVLAETAYTQVLADLKRAGRQMERTPATYRGRDEESLRDQFLLVLQTAYDAAATGETYNKQGKTDILLRHGATNVFIAECKFWRGEAGFLDAINQLLRYLTWQDERTALLLFVDNKGFGAVLDQIAAASRKHPLCESATQTANEPEFRAVFRRDGDPARKVQVAILLFHFGE